MTDHATGSAPRSLFPFLSKHFGNFSFLLIVLLFLMLSHPLVSGDKQGEIFTLGFTLAFLSGLYAIRGEKRTLKVGLFLVVPAILGSWVYFLSDTGWMITVGTLCEAAFFVYVTFVILRYILTEPEVTQDTVWGAMCAYIMIGLVFAIGYSWLERIAPGSFRGVTAAEARQTWEFIYFSLVTMTTLGYGDIVPVHEGARSVATIQAILGQFFVAVLVARIVASLASKPRNHGQSDH
jgi:hypothetical protein